MSELKNVSIKPITNTPKTDLSAWSEIYIIFNWINQPDAAISQVYYLSFKYRSTFLYWYQLDTHFLYKLHKIKFLYMFRASSAHLQEVNDVNCTCMQPLVFLFSAGGRLHLATCREWECQRLHTCTINDIDLLRMGGWRPKHVEAFNFM